MSALHSATLLMLSSLMLYSCSSPSSTSRTVSSTASATVTLAKTGAETPATAYDLRRLASGAQTMFVTGTVAVTGVPQAVGRLPFDAVLAGRDSMRIVMSPLGMTAAKLYATRDSFSFADYFQRQIIDGDPSSQELASVLPFPLSVSDLTSLIRGEVPGDVARFREVSVRQDGSVVFGCDYRDGREFVLVDTAAATLQQYQRKRSDGVIDLNVTFADMKRFDGVNVAMAVDVTVNDRKQTMSFRLSNVEVNRPLPARLGFDAPSGFTRKTFR
ncbi:MAG: DUF4292 domain-containing protein [Candidatus Kapabacteria bacterium]|nr:DUF4292 domain-containing protein [Candidatus Kapabacteria bacterium]